MLWFALLGATCAFGQHEGVRESFEALLQRDGALRSSSPDDLVRFGEQVASAPPDEVSAALPVMVGALSIPDGRARRTCIMAILSVSLRMDSPALLGRSIGAVAGILDFSDAPGQRVGVIILSDVLSRAATPPAGALQPLIAFLRRSDRDLEAQSGAVSVLTRAAPEEAAVTGTVAAFLSRPLDTQSRLRALDGLVSPRLRDTKLIDSVAASVGDPDDAVKVSAISALTRIGPQAIVQAEPALLKLLQEPGHPANLRLAATNALSEIGRTVE
jgi:HEAT repeat protein